MRASSAVATSCEDGAGLEVRRITWQPRSVMDSMIQPALLYITQNICRFLLSVLPHSPGNHSGVVHYIDHREQLCKTRTSLSQAAGRGLRSVRFLINHHRVIVTMYATPTHGGHSSGVHPGHTSFILCNSLGDCSEQLQSVNVIGQSDVLSLNRSTSLNGAHVYIFHIERKTKLSTYRAIGYVD